MSSRTAWFSSTSRSSSLNLDCPHHHRSPPPATHTHTHHPLPACGVSDGCDRDGRISDDCVADEHVGDGGHVAGVGVLAGESLWWQHQRRRSRRRRSDDCAPVVIISVTAISAMTESAVNAFRSLLASLIPSSRIRESLIRTRRRFTPPTHECTHLTLAISTGLPGQVWASLAHTMRAL